MKRSIRNAGLSAEQAWTASVLMGSAALRGGTLLSTLYFIHFLGAAAFAQVVPLTPVAAFVSALALMGQDAVALRALLQHRERRLSTLTTAKSYGIVTGGGLMLGLPVALAVSILFPIRFDCAAMSAAGGVLFTLPQATAIPQMRAGKRGRAYVVCYASYGVVALSARVIAHRNGASDQMTWATGDLAAGIAALTAGLFLARPAWHGGATFGLRSSLKFGIPLISNAVAQQLLGTGDRWIFAGRVPAIQLAIYVASYQVANIISVILSEVNRARQNEYVVMTSATSRSVELSERRAMLQIIGVATLPLALIAAGVSGLNFGESFLIGLGICGSFCSIAYYLPIENLFLITLGRTRPIAMAALVGASVNLVINIALVFRLGVWSGLIANFIGYWCMYAVLALLRRGL